VTRRSWYDWQERPETVSLLTGLAAMHVLGPKASIELVFGEKAAGVGAGVDSAPEMSCWIGCRPRSNMP
jgi:hypothetical protein